MSAHTVPRMPDAAVPQFHRFLVLVGSAAVLLGLLVLFGWHSESRRLVQVYPRSTFMAYNTAVSFVALGSALLGTVLGRRAVARFCAGFAGALMLLTLIEYLSGIRLSTSAIFMQFTHPALGARPVAPNTAVAMLGLALATLLLSGSFSRSAPAVWAALLAAAGFALGANGLAGYVTGFKTFAWAEFTPMAIHTSIGLMVLASGLMLLSWRSIAGQETLRSIWLVSLFELVGLITAISFWHALIAVHADAESAELARVALSAGSLVLGVLATTALSALIYFARTARQRMLAAERAERELRASETLRAYLALIFNSTDEAVMGKDLSGRILTWNPGAERLYGYSAEEVVSRPASMLCPPDRQDEPFELIRRIQRGEKVDRYETMRQRKDGQIIHVAITVSPMLDAEGRLSSVSTIGSDITARKLAEEALKTREHLLRSVIDSSTDLIYAKDRDLRLILCNQAYAATSGRGISEIYGKSDLELGWNPEVVQGSPLKGIRGWEADDRAALGGETIHAEGEPCNVGGEIRFFDTIKAPIRNEHEEIIGIVGISREVTARRQVEAEVRKLNQELRQANIYHRSLIEASLDPLVTIARDGRITDVNRATEQATGWSRQTLIGTDFCGYFTDSERARRGYQSVFQEGFTQDYELEIRHRDGSVKPVLYNASLYRDENGETVGVFAAARDITERRRVEQEIKRLNAELERRVAERTQDLVAVNQELESFNYSVSHDLRAPLRHVDSYAKILLKDHGGEVSLEARNCMQRICAGARKMGLMVDELLELSRISRRELSKQLTGLGRLVGEVIEELKGDLGDRDIEWRLEELPFADCDPNLVHLVFTNLLSNAIKFTRTRKKAVIEIGREIMDGQEVLFVRDNGVGFSMQYADKLFGVFQRLHRAEDFEGTGVGLVTVQRIVNKHGGRIWAEAELGKGAVFYFTLGPDRTAPQPELEPALLSVGEK